MGKGTGSSPPLKITEPGAGSSDEPPPGDLSQSVSLISIASVDLSSSSAASFDDIRSNLKNKTLIKKVSDVEENLKKENFKNVARNFLELSGALNGIFLYDAILKFKDEKDSLEKFKIAQDIVAVFLVLTQAEKGEKENTVDEPIFPDWVGRDSNKVQNCVNMTCFPGYRAAVLGVLEKLTNGSFLDDDLFRDVMNVLYKHLHEVMNDPAHITNWDEACRRSEGKIKREGSSDSLTSDKSGYTIIGRVWRSRSTSAGRSAGDLGKIMTKSKSDELSNSGKVKKDDHERRRLSFNTFRDKFAGGGKRKEGESDQVFNPSKVIKGISRH